MRCLSCNSIRWVPVCVLTLALLGNSFSVPDVLVDVPRAAAIRAIPEMAIAALSLPEGAFQRPGQPFAGPRAWATLWRWLTGKSRNRQESAFVRESRSKTVAAEPLLHPLEPDELDWSEAMFRVPDVMKRDFRQIGLTLNDYVGYPHATPMAKILLADTLNRFRMFRALAHETSEFSPIEVMWNDLLNEYQIRVMDMQERWNRWNSISTMLSTLEDFAVVRNHAFERLSASNDPSDKKTFRTLRAEADRSELHRTDLARWEFGSRVHEEQWVDQLKHAVEEARAFQTRIKPWIDIRMPRPSGKPATSDQREACLEALRQRWFNDQECVFDPVRGIAWMTVQHLRREILGGRVEVFWDANQTAWEYQIVSSGETGSMVERPLVAILVMAGVSLVYSLFVQARSSLVGGPHIASAA